jgi:hypothetical protein
MEYASKNVSILDEGDLQKNIETRSNQISENLFE